MITASFQSPGPLVDGDLELRLRECARADPARGWVPAYHFDMVVTSEIVGHIELRLGATRARSTTVDRSVWGWSLRIAVGTMLRVPAACCCHSREPTA